jgi:hypothetical protein
MPRRKPKKTQRRKRTIPKIDARRAEHLGRMCRIVMNMPLKNEKG